MTIRRKAFSEVGAIRFDADVRALVAWCRGVGVLAQSGGAPGEVGLERLKQINRILGVYDLGDVVGVVEGGGGGGGWLLKKNEVRGYLTLKSSVFGKSDIAFVCDRLNM